MENAPVDALWEQIDALTPEDKLALYQRLEPEAKAIWNEKYAEVRRQMKAKGMIRSEHFTRQRADPPITKLLIEGEPLSETIMKERR